MGRSHSRVEVFPRRFSLKIPSKRRREPQENETEREKQRLEIAENPISRALLLIIPGQYEITFVVIPGVRQRTGASLYTDPATSSQIPRNASMLQVGMLSSLWPDNWGARNNHFGWHLDSIGTTSPPDLGGQPATGHRNLNLKPSNP
jgi:hypothetical protein